MLNEVTRKQLEGQFKAWVREGRRVGALSHALDYDLEMGSKTQGTSYYVVSVNARKERERLSDTIIPPLGRVAITAHARLEAMTKAWAMVR